MDTEKLASARYLPQTPLATNCNETSMGRQFHIHLDLGSNFTRLEVYQPVSGRGRIGSCLITIYEGIDLSFDDAVIVSNALTHAILVAGIWNLDKGKKREKVWG